MTDVYIRWVTFLCLEGVTIDAVAPLLRILTMRVVFNKQARDSPILIINQKFHPHICLRLDVFVNKFS